MFNLLIGTKTEILVSLLEEIFGEERKHYEGKSQIMFDCPVCSDEAGVTYDGKGNLEVNYEKGVFNCWACGPVNGTKGTLNKLVKTFGTHEQYKNYKALKLTFTYETEDGQVIHYEDRNYENVLPKGYEFLHHKLRSDKKYQKYFKYLDDRGITQDIIDKFRIGACLTGKYEDRVVIPSRYDDKNTFNYYVTRTIDKRIKKFKYINAEIDKKTIIFNEALINWEKPICLVEGPFDHIVLPNSIPMLGKTMSDLLFEAIYENAKSYVIIVLDEDAWEDAKKLYYKLDGGRLMNKILICKLPKNLDVSNIYQHGGKELLNKYIIKSGTLK